VVDRAVKESAAVEDPLTTPDVRQSFPSSRRKLDFVFAF